MDHPGHPQPHLSHEGNVSDTGITDPVPDEEVRKADEPYFAYGDHSDVYKGYYRQTTVVIKQFRGVNSNKPEIRAELSQHLQRQLITWKRFTHPNVCKVYKVAEGFGFLPALVTDYFPKGNIINHIRKHNPSVEQRIRWASQIADGLAYLHSFGVHHGDLRGANVFLDDHNRAVIADYAIAHYFNNSDFTSAKSTGTVRWTAPEVIALPPDPNLQPEKIDIFAFGMTMLEIFSGLPPYSDKSDTAAIFALARNEAPKLPESITHNAELKDLFSACTNRAPEARPSAQCAAVTLQQLLPAPGILQRIILQFLSLFGYS
ncbi:kinase-like protein [Macrolepiota fuliginosa MF-IS2]|uniref:Kinase-like protein n=1 Tax=Macrolepiota fuliginosa MF-IS2 TaxID=1400762 RepID=A0A9P5X3U0_9AGAR|nr:kinase-like protein [Macrolepiota fuliginosa MF-IS2]